MTVVCVFFNWRAGAMLNSFSMRLACNSIIFLSPINHLIILHSLIFAHDFPHWIYNKSRAIKIAVLALLRHVMASMRRSKALSFWPPIYFLIIHKNRSSFTRLFWGIQEWSRWHFHVRDFVLLFFLAFSFIFFNYYIFFFKKNKHKKLLLITSLVKFHVK